MDDRLDGVLGRLAAMPTDRRLDHLEARISSAIELREGDALAAAAFAPVRVAAVALALAMGVTAGGAAAAAALVAPQTYERASSAERLAPSNLLEDRR